MTIRNITVAGNYNGAIRYKNRRKGLYIDPNSLFGKKQYINKETVAAYELVDEEQKKSFASGVARGAVGGAIFGPVGAIAGAVTAKHKGTYRVSIEFRDGTRCLCDLDKTMYNNLCEVLY